MRQQAKPSPALVADDADQKAFVRALDGLLQVPRSEIQTAIDKEKAAKKIKAASASRVAVSRKR